ncbi:MULTISPECIES: hypothetical protein [Legionella]|uniref:Uncharacterized protein n=1 Tax=Legionella resiliens TaxID=2905958 RepID=A0ABS8X485_9GAMM|nr:MULTISPECIES: hypothetical protein [unclassified Legionella]MCE0722917.1 hypothetical protein [Legionella sp. 9fVS26]MCE3532070.1 hypothetical protein [Legionella sp. 8cVS16]QLZ68196.1 hypothetical protein FOLKNPGA_00974 [Legionella sp. PC1000]
MKPEIQLIIDALNAVIDETEDFGYYQDKIEFLENENCLLIFSKIEHGNVEASRINKYRLRDNFFKKYLGVSVENIDGNFAFKIPIDELLKVKLITHQINALQNPPVKQDPPKSFEMRRTQHDLQTLVDIVTPSQKVLSRFGSELHFIRLKSPSDVIPKGRDFITKAVDEVFRDNTHAVLAELNTQHRLDNTLFINFTGHEAPVASALYMNGVDCIWQLSIMNDQTSQTRIMDQLQDALPRDQLLSQSPTSHDASLGLILEPNHGFTAIDATKLPTLGQLKEFGIKQVVVLTEKNYNQGKCIYPLEDNYFRREMTFYHWLQSLSPDLNLLIAGVSNFEQAQEENCQSIENALQKKDTVSASTYKLPNFYTLFKNVQQYGTHISPLGFNGVRITTKKDDTDQNSLEESNSLN